MYKALCVALLFLPMFALAQASKATDASVVVARIPTLVARVSLRGQTADIPTTILFTPKVTELYRVSAYIVQTVPGGSTTAWTLGLGWTDDAGVESDNVALYLSPGMIPPYAWGSEGGAEGSNPGSVSIIEAIAGQPVTYSVSTEGPPAGGTYSLYIVEEKL